MPARPRLTVGEALFRVTDDGRGPLKTEAVIVTRITKRYAFIEDVKGAGYPGLAWGCRTRLLLQRAQQEARSEHDAAERCIAVAERDVVSAERYLRKAHAFLRCHSK